MRDPLPRVQRGLAAALRDRRTQLSAAAFVLTALACYLYVLVGNINNYDNIVCTPEGYLHDALGQVGDRTAVLRMRTRAHGNGQSSDVVVIAFGDFDQLVMRRMRGVYMALWIHPIRLFPLRPVLYCLKKDSFFWTSLTHLI